MSSSSLPSPTATGYGGAQPPPHNYLSNLDFSYALVIALGFLSTIILVSCVCFCITRRRQTLNHNSSVASSENGVILPRIYFVAEDGDGGEESQNGVVGLNQSVINSYPKFPFSKNSKSDSVCPICLCEYKDLEMLRMLPECRHFFHLTCIDAWLKLNASCPVCRSSPLPTPMSTPLSEVVPLSQYSDGRNRRR